MARDPVRSAAKIEPVSASGAEGFVPPAFAPAGWLANPHIQTVWPFLFRPRPPFEIANETWTLPDGENLAVHLTESDPERPGVLVIHGLEGSVEASYMVGMLDRIRRAGWNGAAFDLRSCGRSARKLPPSKTAYHAGKTDDLAFVAQCLRERWEGPLAVIGFSIGGNMVLKYLGESGTGALVDAAVAVSVPFDLAVCAAHVDGRGFWNGLYRKRFLQSLRRKARALAKADPTRLDGAAVAAARTFAAFDDVVTARLFGFEGAEDYWRRCSAAGFITDIRRPCLIVSSVDDPIVPAEAIPLERIEDNPALTLWLTEKGGHVGFFAGSMRRPIYVAEEGAVAFLKQQFARLGTPIAGNG